MTQLEKQNDANELMSLEMMDSVTGGAQMCSEGCLFACTQSCFLSKKVKNTEAPTSTPAPTTPTGPTSEN
jgi:hypothetical protein